MDSPRKNINNNGNAIASCMVLGARSGKFAALFAGATDFAKLDPLEASQELKRLESFHGESKLDPNDLEREIKNLAWESAGVVRNEIGLKAGVDRFEEIRRDKIPLLRGNDQRSWIKALNCANLAWVGEMVTRSALERRESRGQHYRDDYPVKEKGLPKWIKISKNEKSIDCKSESIPFDEGDLMPSIKDS
jgi:succinate dehydrogenase/fumarate reductase flavoprotein subunit